MLRYLVSRLTICAALASGCIASTHATAQGLESGASRMQPFPKVTVQDPARAAGTAQGKAEGLSGKRAVDGLGANIDAVARWYGMTGDSLRGKLLKDRQLRVARDGQLFFIEMSRRTADAARPAATVRGINDGELAPLDQTFKLHSKPGSAKTLYLNFAGATLQNTLWNTSSAPIRAVAFDIDGNPASFSTEELQRIQYIWQRVAEDFSPLDMNVTTERPPQDRLSRSSTLDQIYGGTVLFTNTQEAFPCECGGLAYLHGFGNDVANTGLVFTNMLGNGDEKDLAEAASHEAGHLLGLLHDGSPEGDYYQGHGSSTVTGWAPIMGVGFDQPLSQWSKGEYANANNKEDDLAVMQQFVPIRADDAGDTRQATAVLPVAISNGAASGTVDGIISRQGDKDLYSFSAGKGSFRATVTPAMRSPNADLVLTLLNASGMPLASSNPLNALDATLAYQIFQPGTYYLQVGSTGQGNPATDGYSSYGSLGNYRLQASFVAPAGTPPVASLVVTPASGPAPLAVRLDATGSRDDGQVKFIYWNFGDGTTDNSGTLRVANKTYSSPGTYLVAIRVVDDKGLTSTASQTVTVNTPGTNPGGSALTAQVTLNLISMSANASAASGTLLVKDRAGRNLPNATVRYNWSGLLQGSRVVTSKTTGTPILSLASSRKGCFVLTVTGITLAGYTYNAAAPATAQVCR